MEDSNCFAIQNSFECARKIESVKESEAGNFILRKGDTLYFGEASFNEFRLIDSDSQGDSAKYYSYLGFVKPLKSFLIHVQFNEGEEILLINSLTGQNVSLIGLPVLAPDSLSFATFNLGLGSLFPDNIIEVWGYEDGMFVLEFRYTDETWGPVNVDWKDQKTLIIKKAIMNSDSSEVIVSGNEILVKKNGKWLWK